MPYMDIKIVGSGGTSGMRKSFERDFDSRMGSGANTSYKWRNTIPRPLPGGMVKVLEILENATMNSTPVKPKPEPKPDPGDTGQQVPPPSPTQVQDGGTGQQLPLGQDRFCTE